MPLALSLTCSTAGKSSISCRTSDAPIIWHVRSFRVRSEVSGASRTKPATVR